MLAIDYVGVATLITATFAGIASVAVVFRQTSTKQQVNEVHAAVSTSNGATLGQVVENIDRATGTAAVPPITPPAA